MRTSNFLSRLIWMVIGLMALMLFRQATSPVRAAETINRYPQAALACTPDTPGLISYWPFDASIAFQDVIGTNHASCPGANCPVQAGGRVGEAYDIDAADLLSVPDATSLNWPVANTASFSIELWVNTTQMCAGNKVFAGKAGDATASSWWVGCDSTTAAAVFFLRDSNNNPSNKLTSGSTVINDGKWHHVVAIRQDGFPDQVHLFVDGVLKQSAEATNSGSFTNDGPLTIGYFLNEYHFVGKVDELAIYNRALTPVEIERHYRNGAGQSYCEDAPFAGDDGPFTIGEDSQLSFTSAQLLANDYDLEGDAIDISAIDAASAQGGTITANGGGNYFYKPALNFSGTDTFTYTLTDAKGSSSIGTVTVTVTPVADPPVIVDPGTQQSVEGDNISLAVVVNDPDMDEKLAFQAAGLPPDLSIDPGTGLITGLVSYKASPGSPYTVQISVTDSASLSDSSTFTWTVVKFNRPPVVVGPGSQSNDPSQAVSLQIVASDPDEDLLAYSASGLPVGLNINSSTGEISGVLAPGVENTYFVYISVTDGDKTMGIVFRWTVGKPKVFFPTIVHTVADWGH